MVNEVEAPDGRDFTPDTSVILYMRKQNLNWPTVVKELIDNAIDAGASLIRLTMTRHLVRIEDNGRGCPDLLDMITLGKREEYETTQIGHYGIGAKDAFIWLAERLAIASVCQGLRREVSIDWEVILRQKRWHLPHPITEHSTTEPTGTRIELTRLLHGRPDKQRLIDELSRTYMPALREGCQIFLKHYTDPDFTPIKPFSFPPLHPQQHETMVVDGKRVAVSIGLIPPDVTIESRGLMCLYGPRVILHQKRLGIPPEALPQIFGWIEFSREWTLEKNKRDFLDDLDPLEDAIEERFAALFTLAAQRQTDEPLENVARWINEGLKSLRHRGRPRKARRSGPHVKEGTVLPTGTGGKHTQAAQDQPGQTFIKKQVLSMQFAPMGAAGPLCSVIDDVLTLNSEDPCMQEAKDNEQLLRAHTLWAVSSYLVTQPDLQLVMPWGSSYDLADRIFAMAKRLSGQGRSPMVAMQAEEQA
jgi:hypothetical protein